MHANLKIHRELLTSPQAIVAMFATVPEVLA